LSEDVDDIQRLQSVQNAAARLIFNLRGCDLITDALISLHWLRVPERITFKVATLTYRALHGSEPLYLASSFTCVADMPHRRRLSLPPLNNLMFRPVVGQLSEVVLFLLLEHAKRSYISLVTVGVQEQAEDILVPPLLRNCLTFSYIPLS